MNEPILTIDAYHRYQQLSLAHRPFYELPGFSLVNKKNRGFAGQWLEKLLHTSPHPCSNHKTDFIDGDLKTFAITDEGNPRDTIAITTISSIMSDIERGLPFEETQLYKKIEHLLLIPIHRPSQDVGSWRFLEGSYIHITPQLPIFHILKDEYEDIASAIRYGFIRKLTFSDLELRRTYFEVRTKDSTPYRPITKNGFSFSNKGRAFFFRKPCVTELLNASIPLSS
ncbi:hypothetical protein CN918_26000 [Priestia megaterium]|nr:hypothetical protein CN918_26000 [Priestia megaterium]